MAHYLLLVGYSPANMPSVQRLRQNLLTKISDVYPLWTDTAHIGIAMTTDLSAVEIWHLAAKGAQDLRDMLVLELGRDWCGVRETKNSGWLNAHLGPCVLRPGRPS